MPDGLHSTRLAGVRVGFWTRRRRRFAVKGLIGLLCLTLLVTLACNISIPSQVYLSGLANAQGAAQAVKAKHGQVKYQVQYLAENGKLLATENETGSAEATVNVAFDESGKAPLKQFAGYSYDAANKANLTSATLAKDGSTVLQAYYRKISQASYSLAQAADFVADLNDDGKVDSSDAKLLDANGDGQVSAAEIARYDAKANGGNADGMVSAAEYLAVSDAAAKPSTADRARRGAAPERSDKAATGAAEDKSWYDIDLSGHDPDNMLQKGETGGRFAAYFSFVPGTGTLTINAAPPQEQNMGTDGSGTRAQVGRYRLYQSPGHGSVVTNIIYRVSTPLLLDGVQVRSRSGAALEIAAASPSAPLRLQLEGSNSLSLASSAGGTNRDNSLSLDAGSGTVLSGSGSLRLERTGLGNATASAAALGIAGGASFELAGARLSARSGDLDNTSCYSIANHGSMRISSGSLTESWAAEGGAVRNFGDLTISGGRISACRAKTGGAVYNSGSMSISGGSISDNSASDKLVGGGAIYNSGSVEISSGQLCDNLASAANGGAITVASGASLEISGRANFSGNRAPQGAGGALYLADCSKTDPAPLMLPASASLSFSGNSAASLTTPEAASLPLAGEVLSISPSTTAAAGYFAAQARLGNSILAFNNFDINGGVLRLTYATGSFNTDHKGATAAVPATGTAPVDPTQYQVGSEATIMGNAGTTPLSLPGYTMLGWSEQEGLLNPSSSEDYYRPGSRVRMSAPVTLYPVMSNEWYDIDLSDQDSAHMLESGEAGGGWSAYFSYVTASATLTILQNPPVGVDYGTDASGVSANASRYRLYQSGATSVVKHIVYKVPGSAKPLLLDGVDVANDGSAGGTGATLEWESSAELQLDGRNRISNSCNVTTDVSADIPNAVHVASGAKMTVNNASGASGKLSAVGGIDAFNPLALFVAGIYNDGQFSLVSGIIDGCTSQDSSATSSPCGIYNNGQMQVSGGTISGGKAKKGGAIYNNANLSVSGGTISGNTATADGGAIAVLFDATFSMTGGTVSGNTANDGGALFLNSTTPATLQGVSFTGNRANADGGALYAQATQVSVKDCTFGGATASAGNGATGDGGAIYAQATTISLAGASSVAHNQTDTGNGGGIYLASGNTTAILTDTTTVSANQAVSSHQADGNGGGVYVGSQAVLRLGAGASAGTGGDAFRGSFSGNVAQGDGGAIYLQAIADGDNSQAAADLQVEASTVATFRSNSAGSLVKPLAAPIALAQSAIASISTDSMSASDASYFMGSAAQSLGLAVLVFNNYDINTAYMVIYHKGDAPSSAASISGEVPQDPNFYRAGDKPQVLGNVGGHGSANDGSNPLKAGDYLFLGWTTQEGGITDPSGSDTYYVPGSELPPMTGYVSLYPVWSSGPHKSVTDAGVSVDGGTAHDGDTLVYTITGAAGAGDSTILVTDQIPQGLTELTTLSTTVNGVATTSLIQPTLSSSTPPVYTWEFDGVAAGSTVMVRFSVKVDYAAMVAAGIGVLTNQAEVDTRASNTTKVTVPGSKTVAEASAPQILLPDGSQVHHGDTLQYTVSATNSSAAAADLKIVDALPEGLSFVSGSAVYQIGSATVSSGVSQSITGQTITWTFSNIAAGQTVKVTFKATVTTDAGTIANAADIKIGDNTYTTDTTTVEVPGSKTVAEAATPQILLPDGSQIHYGDELQYTVSALNTSDTVADLKIVDALPEGLSFVSGSAVYQIGSATVSSGVSQSITGQTVTWTFATVQPGVKVKVSFKAKVTLAAGTLPNSADIQIGDNTYTTDRVTLEVPGSKTVAEASAPQILLPDGSQVHHGDTLQYTVSALNTATSASSVQIIDSLSSGLSFLDGSALYRVAGTSVTSGVSQSVSGPTVAWIFSDVPAGAVVSVTFKATVTAEVGAIPNSAAIQIGGNTYNTNLVTVEVPGSKSASLAATPQTLLPDGSQVHYGDVLQYNVTAQNTAGAPADIQIRDSLPAGLTFVSGSAAYMVDGSIVQSGVSQSVSGQNLTWTFSNIGAGSIVKVAFHAQVTVAAGQIVNSADIQIGDNSYTTNQVKLTGAPTKTASTAHSDGSVDPGAAITYTIYVTNSAQSAQNLTINDTIPSGTTYQAGSAQTTPSSASVAYDSTTRILVATFNSLAAGQTARLSFKVAVDTDTTGTVYNSANVQIGSNRYTTNQTANKVNPKYYHLTYSANGGSGAPVDSHDYTAGSVVTLSSHAPSRSGYSFLGWSTIQGASPPSHSMVTQVTIEGNVTVYAQWSKNETPQPPSTTYYHVSYNANGGQGSVPEDATKYRAGDRVTVATSPKPTRSGYDFSGWSLSRHGRGAVHHFTIEHNTTLYAIWTKHPTPTPNPPTPNPPAPNPPAVTPAPTTPTPTPATAQPVAGGGATLIMPPQVPTTPTPVVAAAVPDGAWSLLSLIMSLIALIGFVLLLINLVAGKKRKYAQAQAEQSGLGAGYGPNYASDPGGLGDSLYPYGRESAQLGLAPSSEQDEGYWRQRRKSQLIFRVIAMVAGLLTPIVWLILDDLHQPMTWINQWTIYVAIIFLIFAIALIAFLLCSRRKRVKDDGPRYGQSQPYYGGVAPGTAPQGWTTLVTEPQVAAAPTAAAAAPSGPIQMPHIHVQPPDRQTPPSYPF
jgi:fimbrial isopeptide formation D2 family protein/uncharacterized repeat protein (TIGR01451 family)/uncharacterized repeat protein (TIGR02543 family)